MVKAYRPNDSWAQRAREAGYRSRSVYKLQELDQKYGLLKPGMWVLDLGAAPGSWLQYASAKIGKSGLVLGVDLEPIGLEKENVIAKVGDITNRDWLDKEIRSLGWQKADLILSDVMANTSGIKELDSAQSLELDRAVFAIAQRWLKPGGFLVMKVFESEDLPAFLVTLKKHFSQVEKERVQATRSRSREVYLVCW